MAYEGTCFQSNGLTGRENRESSTSMVVFVYLCVIFAIFSTVANGLILCTMAYARELRGTFYRILTSLFVSDFITASVIFPLLAALNATFATPNCAVVVTCELLIHTMSLAGILSMLAIAYDRYLRASKRQSYNLYMKKTKGNIIIVIIWTLSLITGVISTFVYSRTAVILAIMTIVAILTLYAMTMKKLKANKSQVVDTISSRVSIPCHKKGIKRSSRLIFVLIVVLLLSWFPCIVISIRTGRMLYSTDEYILTVVQQLPLLSAVTSPILYFWTNRTTRRCFVAFCDKICRRQQSQQQIDLQPSHG
eukprot:gene9982-11004_t